MEPYFLKIETIGELMQLKILVNDKCGYYLENFGEEWCNKSIIYNDICNIAIRLNNIYQNEVKRELELLKNIKK